MRRNIIEKKIILVVDDNRINRKILGNILLTEYDVVEAENGQEAYEILNRKKEVAAIILDIMMPVMDGFTFLKKLPGTPYMNLPILVQTGSSDNENEQRALDLGAWDFVPKPCAPNILLSRLKNAIARSQLNILDQVKFANEHDALTGLFNRTKYFEETRLLLDQHPAEKFVILCLNIDQFRTFNFFWGEKEGNQFLNYVAGLLRKEGMEADCCTYGRIEADIFSICRPFDEEIIWKHSEEVGRKISAYKQDYMLRVSLGVYVVDDPGMDVGAMYSRAALAATECRKKFAPLCYYRQEMRDSILKEQRIVNEMQQALDEGQFIIYLQPKYNLKTEKPYGAEALTRWQHPKKGLIPPGEFIPVFEHNGFIGKLDYYIWERVCRLLRKWLEEGKTPGPVSVNISRVNLYNPKLVDLISGLAEKYRIPPKLLNLEITESTYMENPAIMREVINRLHKKGFLIMMDDFGSGYSSLNTLKDIQIDILKIDMKFLSSEEENDRGTRILASVIRMAGWLELPVIVEGVETRQQKEFLEDIGCGYVQGYYFARPMPVNEYEALVNGISQEPAEKPAESIGDIAEVLWSRQSHIDLLFNSIALPVAVFEFDEENTRELRVNKKYNEEFGYGEKVLDTGMAYQNHFSEESRKKLRETFREAIRCRGSAFSECPTDGGKQWVRVDLQYWGNNGNSAILFAMFRRIDAPKQKGQRQTDPGQKKLTQTEPKQIKKKQTKKVTDPKQEQSKKRKLIKK